MKRFEIVYQFSTPRKVFCLFVIVGSYLLQTFHKLMKKLFNSQQNFGRYKKGGPKLE